MNTLSYILFFVFGTIMGSFLNVVSLRFNTGTTLGGRSKCMSCGNQLTWKELIPILSFAFQKGTCKKCRSKISWQYPLVEFFAGIVFVMILLTFPPVTTVMAVKTILYLLAACLLLVITAYDIKHKIIPDSFVYSFALVALVSLYVGGESWLHVPSLGAIAAGPLLALPFALLWVVSKGTWMGLGDAKLVVGIGWFLGIAAGINALILSFWIAALLSILWLFITYRKFKPGTEIPFGPYLILGMYLVIFFDIQVMDVSPLKDILLSYF